MSARTRSAIAPNPNPGRCAPEVTRAQYRAIRAVLRDPACIRAALSCGPLSADDLLVVLVGEGGLPYGYVEDGSLLRGLDAAGAVHDWDGTTTTWHIPGLEG